MSDQTITLTRIYNPLDHADKDHIQWTYKPGATVADLLDSTGAIITDRSSVRFAVSVNGVQVPAEQYALTRLIPGQQVAVVPYLYGGGGGGAKDILRMVGMVVIMVVAAVLQQYWAEGLIASGWGATAANMVAALGSAAIMVGGSLLLNAVLPASKPNVPSLNGYGSIDQSNSYSWNPQNTQQQGITIPSYYGTCKISGNIVGVYRETVGSKQYINVLTSLGNGPISPPYDMKLNNQPIANYTGITIDTRLGHINQESIPSFGSTIIEYPLGNKIIYGTPVAYTTIGNSFDGLSIMVGFPNGLYYYSDTGALTAVAVNFSIEIRKQGDTDWSLITETVVGSRISDGGYWSLGRVIPNYTGGGGEAWYEVSNGGTNPNSHYDGELGPDATFWKWIGSPIRIVTTTLPYIQVSGAQMSALVFTYRVTDLPSGPGKYDIRVSRLSADYTDTRHGDDFYLLTVQELVQDNFTYPGTALIGLRALATDQLSGSFSFECKTAGKLCRVYDGTTWTVVATSNPAWICFDILTQPVFDNDLNVLEYAAHDPANLDLARWLEWAEYCDDLVPDGKGGTEPRLTFNGGFDSKQSMWDAALNVAKIGRATPYWRGTTITLAIDKPSSPVALISVGNIGLDSFEETFLSMENRAGSIEADFLNIEKELDRDKFTVINPDAPAEWGSASLPLQGVIKPSEIWRHCRYYLATTQQLIRIVNVQMDIDSIAFTIGDVINVQHDVPMWGEGGRIVSATSTSVMIDRDITIEAGKTYSIMIRLLDGTIVERNITNAAGTTDTLTISTPFASIPVAYDVYACGEVSQSIKPMRVASIDPAGDLKRKITLTDYNESVYNTDLMLPVIPTQNYSGLALSTVTGLLLAERMIKSPGGLVTTWLDISWMRLVPNFLTKNIEVLVNGVSAGILPVDATGISVQVADGATATVYVRTIGWVGNKQALNLAATSSKYIIGKTARPADVTGLTATTTTTGALRLDWLPVPDIDIDYYELVLNQSGPNWNSSIGGIKSYSSSITLPAALSGTYMIKAVDTSGNKSVNAASIVVAMPTDSYHTQQTLAESTSFTGLKTGCNVVSGKLELDVAGQWDGSQAVGYYYASQTIDLGSVQPARCLCSLDFLGIDTQLTWDDVVDVDAVPDVDAIGTIGNAEGCELQPQIAISQDGSNWGDWQPFTIGDYPGRAFKFRLKLISTVITSYPQVSALQFKLLLPYRNQIMPDVVLPATATTIALTPAFVNKPVVKADIQNAQSGDTVKITDVSTSQFTIQILNGGAGMVRTVDIEATGT